MVSASLELLELITIWLGLCMAAIYKWLVGFGSRDFQDPVITTDLELVFTIRWNVNIG